MNLKYFCEDHRWQVDIDSGVLWYDAKEIDMTLGAKQVVKYLVNHPMKTCSYEALHDAMKDGAAAKHMTRELIQPNYSRAIQDIFNDQIKKCPYFDEKTAEGREHIAVKRGIGMEFKPSHDIVFRLMIDRDKVGSCDVVSPIEDFCGRSPDLRSLMDQAFRQSHLLVLSGPAGIGKTELARAFIHRCMKADTPAALCFRKVIWTTFDKTIKQTISNLPSDSLAMTSFERNLEALRDLSLNNALLVIDNVDTLWDRDEMDDLLGTGCHILLTSKLDLKDAHPSLRQYAVPLLSTDELVQLFFKKSNGWISADAAEEVRDLIENDLHRNTYLTVLTAGLVDLYSIEKIKQKLRSLTVCDIKTSVTGCKDGDLSKNQPLFDHFRTLFEAAPLNDYQNRLMFLLALLPVGGMPQRWFFDHAFEEDELEKMTAARNELRRRYFCFVENRNGESHIKIQPLMREVILREGKNWIRKNIGKLTTYLTNLIRKLDRAYYHPETPLVLQAAVAALTGLKIIPEDLLAKGKVPLYTQLICQCVSVFDIVRNGDAIREWADEAAEWLSRLHPQAWTWEEDRSDILLCLTAYNNLAYPLTHIGKTDLSAELYHKAIEILAPHREKIPDDDAFAIKVSKIYNNLGASYLKDKKYGQALEIHREELKQRQQLAKNSSSDHTPLLAASHKAIGTDLYYLGSYAESYKHHEIAVQLYRDSLGEDSLEFVTALNRMIGAGICSGDQKSCGQWLRQLNLALRYLRTIAFVESEVINAVRHTATIVTKERNFQQEGAEILTLANAFPKTDKLSEAIKALEAVL